jgi:hypothetical protein
VRWIIQTGLCLGTFIQKLNSRAGTLIDLGPCKCHKGLKSTILLPESHNCFVMWNILENHLSYIIIVLLLRRNYRSQWPRLLRHALSPPAQTLGSCVRFPLVSWIYLCVYSVFVLFCMQVAALRWASSHTDSVKWLIKWKRGQFPTKYCRAIDIWING